MFSGLIAFEGRVATVEGDRARGLTLVVESAAAVADGVAAGDSVAVNGACLTVVAVDDRTMRFDVVPETVDRTGFDRLRAGDRLNVELSLRVGDRLGGHIVYGHVDGSASILAKHPEGQGVRLVVSLPDELVPYVVEKGYVAIDGVSVTVASADTNAFTVAVIPETVRRTTLGVKGAGERVNLEIDPVARYAVGAATVYGNRHGSAPTAEEVAWAYEI